MLARRHARIGILLLAGLLARSGSAIAAQSDDGWLAADDSPERPRVAPPVGTWSLVGESPSGKRFTGTLVILDNTRSAVQGYVRWKSPGKPSNIEVFIGDYDSRSQRLTFHGFEVLTRRTQVGVGRYTAKYDVEDRDLTDGTAIPISKGNVRGYWTAHYREALPSSLPKLMNLPYGDGNWPKLCRNLSEGFARGRIGHWHFPNTPELEELADSSDDRLQMLARLRRGQEALSRWADPKSGKVPEADASRIEAAKKILKDEFPSQSTGKGSLSPILQQLVDQDTNARSRQQLNMKRLATRALEGLMASVLRRQLIEAASPMRQRSELKEGDIRARCRPAMEGGLVARVTNKSGKDLNRCLIVTQFSVDPKELASASKQAIERKLAESTIDEVLGLKRKYRRSSSRQRLSQALFDYYWAYESLDKGAICYLENWPNDETIDVDLAPAPCHCIEGTIARVSVFSANGSLDVSIGEPSLRVAFGESRAKSKAAVVSKPKKKVRRHRRRVPT